jgi:isoquinoline 1-oxidoreductase beta subunit
MIPETSTRRWFLKASTALTGGLLLSHEPTPAQASAREFALNAWLRIGTDDSITLISAQSEMGQGAMTTLPAILAEELGADWTRVRIEFSPVAEAYRNPRINWQFTGNSESMTGFFELLRSMGASARTMLEQAAAQRWSVAPAECKADVGRVVHTASKRSLRFGELAEAASRLTAPDKPTLRDPREWRLLGKSLPRVEMADKIRGKAVFGMDFMIPGMVHAAVRHVPVFGGKVKSWDKESIAGLPGVIDIVAVPNGVAVVAEQYWHASRALRRLTVTFDQPDQSLTSEALDQQYRAALSGTKWKTVLTEGPALDEARIQQESKKTFSQEYESQFLAHATMEPMNCTALFKGDACEIWGPLQGPELTRLVVAGTLQIDAQKVAVNRTLLGGGFGRRLLADLPLEAALISKAVGRPVKVVWSREEDMIQDVYRPATLHRITATLDDSGEPRVIGHKLVSPSILQFVYRDAVTEDNDPSCLEGLLETHYRLPSQRVDFHLLKTKVPTSVLRTTGYGPNIFAMESFIDELAHKAGKDPYEYRRKLLKDERAVRVLDTVIDRSNWKRRPPKGVLRGLAITEAFRTHIAHVVELTATSGIVKIHRITCVIDCGVALDPGICRNSIEGGAMWGLGCAFKSGIHFAQGRTVESNFHDYKILTMEEAPPVDVHIVNSNIKELGGTGEVGPVTLIPALTNALFAATGKRYRSLPLSRHGLKLRGLV